MSDQNKLMGAPNSLSLPLEADLDNEFRDLFFDKTAGIVRSYTPPAGRTKFHYTSAAGFVGIVSNNSLWFSDTKFMNDGSESTWGMQIFKSAVEEVKSSLDSDKKRRFIDQIYSEEQGFSEMFRSIVFCLSSEGNLLNQWRDYGRDVVPYCIEIDTTDLLRMDTNFKPALRSLVYKESDQRRMVVESLHEMLKVASMAWGRPENELDRLATWASFEMSDVVGRLKHPAFEAEREARLVISHYALSSDGLRPKYRVGQLGAVPFYEFAPSNDAKLPIRSVRVGPSPYAAASVAAAEMMLRDYDFIDVPVMESAIPLRR